MNKNPGRTRVIPSDVVRYIGHSRSIAKQIDLLIKEISKNQVTLAIKLGKSESEISKWMSGTHNFTLKTISKIEAALDETIILCPREIEGAKKIADLCNKQIDVADEKETKIIYLIPKSQNSYNSNSINDNFGDYTDNYQMLGN